MVIPYFGRKIHLLLNCSHRKDKSISDDIADKVYIHSDEIECILKSKSFIDILI